MVRALHAAGVEVILDVVYNHTGKAATTDRRWPSAASTTAPTTDCAATIRAGAWTSPAPGTRSTSGIPTRCS